MAKKKNELPGSVYFNKQRNNYTVSYKIKDFETGKETIKRKSFDDEESAYNFLKELQFKQGSKIYKKNSSIPLNELLKFLATRKYNNGIVGKAQYCKLLEYISYIEKNDFAKKDISEITSEELQNYYNTLMKYSKSYMSKYMGIIEAAFSYANGKGFVRINPLLDTVKPKSRKPKKRVRALTIEEQTKLNDYLKNVSIEEEPYKNAYLIQMYMGLRIGEVLALQDKDIDLRKNVISINKTLTVDENEGLIMGDTTKTYAGLRDIPIPDIIRQEIIEQVIASKTHFDNQLFVSKTGYYANPKSVNTVLKRILLNEFGITDISSNCLRHTFATRCKASGIDPVVIKSLMGHTKINMALDNYIEAQEDFKEVELEKLSNFYEDRNITNRIINKFDKYEEFER